MAAATDAPELAVSERACGASAGDAVTHGKPASSSGWFTKKPLTKVLGLKGGEAQGVVTEGKKAELLRGVGELDEAGKKFCSDKTLERYLRARKGDVRKSTKLLHDTLVWRREIKIESMKAEDCMKYIDKGLFYIYGWDDSHKPIIVARKRQEPMNPDEVDPYFKFIMFSLEQVQKSMPEQAHQWVQLLDLNGYSKKNAPPVKMGIAVINAFANHFPERLAHCYVIDAPTIFWVLYTAVWPFVDPVTRAKVHFVYTKDYKETGERKDGNEDSTRFSKYYKAWATQFDKARYMKILEELG